MKVTERWLRGRRYRRWECCGNVWELFVTKWRKGDADWAPVCLDCQKRRDSLRNYALRIAMSLY